MGDRGQVHIIGDGYKEEENSHIWLYTHWGCDVLIDDVRQALIKARGNLRRSDFGGYDGRWKDGEYLARIIFQTMIGDDDGLTGYGIYGGPNGMHEDVYRTVTVNVEEQTVKVYTDHLSQYTSGPKLRFEGSFEEFIATPKDSILWFDPED